MIPLWESSMTDSQIIKSVSTVMFPLSALTCFSFCWTLSADFVSLIGPDIDSMENSRPQAYQPVWGTITCYRDVWTGSLSRSVTQHVSLYFSLGLIPGDCCSVLCYFGSDEICWSINIWRRKKANKKKHQKELKQSNNPLEICSYMHPHTSHTWILNE